MLYGKLEDYGVNLDGLNRKQVIELLKLPASMECFHPEDQGYMVINVEEGSHYSVSIMTRCKSLHFHVIDGIPVFTIPRNVFALTDGNCLMSMDYQEGDGMLSI